MVVEVERGREMDGTIGERILACIADFGALWVFTCVWLLE